MASGMLTDSMIVRLMAKVLGDHLQDDATPFHCKVDFELPTIARAMTVDDFLDWYARPTVQAALCYAENGAGSPLLMPHEVLGDRACYAGAEVRYLHAYDVGTDRDRHRLDIRFPI